MPISRNAIDQIADLSDLDALGLRFDSIDDPACALLAYQRTKQISRKSRLGWEAGAQETMLTEVKERKEDIIRGAFLEIYQEYLPTRMALKSRKIASVCDIGCGQGINDVLLQNDYGPRFTLVDIEETDEQYHLWAKSGSGYASLASAKALRVENGASAGDVVTVNPKKTSWAQTGHQFDLVTSFYSCGFHYPVDEYIALFLDTVNNGGAVCLDFRNNYVNRGSDVLSSLWNAGRTDVVYEDEKSKRMLFQK